MRTVRLFSSLSNNIGGLLNFGNGHLEGLLNRSISGLGRPGLISVDLISYKDIYINIYINIYIYIYISISIITFLHGSFDKFYICFCFSVALKVIRW